MRNLGILLSGRGSNFVAIAEAIDAGRLDAKIAVVLSNSATAHGLKIAKERGIPAFAVPSAFRDQSLIEHLRAHKVDLVCLAGYMRILSPIFITTFRDRIVNIHPSLLPAFPGLNAQHQALAHGVKITGCTVHHVTAEVDGGPIIDQAAVRVEPTDTLDSLTAKVHAAEHALLPAVIARLSEVG